MTGANVMRSALGTVDSLSRERERARVRARELRRASPDAERLLWQRLRNRQLDGFKFRRQHPNGCYFADFACVEARLVIELDGGQHLDADVVTSDARRTADLRAIGFHVLRFDNRQALSETDHVLRAILDWLQFNHPHPNSLPPAGEGVQTMKDAT